MRRTSLMMRVAARPRKSCGNGKCSFWLVSDQCVVGPVVVAGLTGRRVPLLMPLLNRDLLDLPCSQAAVPTRCGTSRDTGAAPAVIICGDHRPGSVVFQPCSCIHACAAPRAICCHLSGGCPISITPPDANELPTTWHRRLIMKSKICSAYRARRLGCSANGPPQVTMWR
jgi:hypothetical protein